MTPAILDSSPPDQASGIPSRSQERTHPTGLWPAGLRSQRKTRAQRIYTGLSLPYTPYLTGCDSCAAEVTVPAFLHRPQPRLAEPRSNPQHAKAIALRSTTFAAQAPTRKQRRASTADSVAPQLGAALTKLTPLCAPLPKPLQPQSLLTPSARHRYPFGSTKGLNMMPESYERASAKR